MEKESLKKIKQALLAEKDRLEKELGDIAKRKGKKFTPVYPEYGSKDEENAAEITEYELHLALDKNLEKLLADVVKALAKIEQGTYGHCENCDQEIPAGRLEAYPAATFCISCQAKKDGMIKRFFSKFKDMKNGKNGKNSKKK